MATGLSATKLCHWVRQWMMYAPTTSTISSLSVISEVRISITAPTLFSAIMKTSTLKFYSVN